MDIRVDDQPYQTTGSPDQTIRELANEVCDSSQHHSQRIVVALHCDGNEVGPEGLDAVLELPARQFQRLEMHTQPVGPLIQDTLAKAIGLFEQAAQSRHQIADLLEEGQHNDAMQQFQKLLDIWQQVQQTMLVCAQMTRIDLDSLRINDMGLTDVLESVKNQLNELKSSMENRDFVLVGDILRYELDEPLTNWLAILNDLAGQSQAKHKKEAAGPN